LAFSAIATAAWWYSRPRGVAAAYLIYDFDPPLPITDSPLTEQQRKRRKTELSTLALSPLVMTAAISRQDIAQLDLVRSHQQPLMWLLDGDYTAEFPGGGEIIELKLSHLRSDQLDQGEKLLAALSKSFQNKVLFEYKLRLAQQQQAAQKTLEYLKPRMAEVAKKLEAQKQPDPAQPTASRWLLEAEAKALQAQAEQIHHTLLRIDLISHSTDEFYESFPLRVIQEAAATEE
jgi:hypothetical protein